MVKSPRFFVGISHRFKAKVFSSRLELFKITKKRFSKCRIVVGPFTSKRAYELEELWNKYNKKIPLISKTRKNPMPFTNEIDEDGKVKIYDRIIQIDAIQGSDSEFPNQQFYHEFKKSSKAKIYSLTNGDILIQGNCNLWKVFNY